MGEDLLGRHEIRSHSFLRTLAMDSFAALPEGHPMTAFMEFDVTEAQARIAAMRRRGVRVSLFAHVLRCLAVSLAAHPELNAVKHGRRVAYFEDVDISVPVEADTEDGRSPLQLVIRRAQDRSAPEIYAEIEAARRAYVEKGALGEEDRWARRMMRLAQVIPRALRIALLRALIRNARTVKRRAGTTLLTSVGKFAAIPGFVSQLATGPRATSFAMGSVVEKPVVRQGEICVRWIQSVTAIFDHDLVDGGPAARFARRWQALVEQGDGLDPLDTSATSTSTD